MVMAMQRTEICMWILILKTQTFIFIGSQKPKDSGKSGHGLFKACSRWYIFTIQFTTMSVSSLM